MAKPKKDPEKPLPDGPLPEGFDIANLPKGEAAPIEDVEFEGKTLSGDVRDILLGHIRSMSKPWAMMSEQEQTDKIHAITETGKHVVRGVVSVVTRNKFPAVHVIVGAWKVDKALKSSRLASLGRQRHAAGRAQGRGGAVDPGRSFRLFRRARAG